MKRSKPIESSSKSSNLDSGVGLPTGTIVSSFFSSSSDDTMAFASRLASQLPRNQVIALCGDLGAGKTTFVKGLAKGLRICEEVVVSSPTFAYLHIYEGDIPLFHFDLYRFDSKEEFSLSGFEEHFSENGISCVEWPEHAFQFLPESTVFIDFFHRGEQEREIVVRSHRAHKEINSVNIYEQAPQRK